MSEPTCRFDPAEMPVDQEEYEAYERNLALWRHKENLALQEEADHEAKYWDDVAKRKRDPEEPYIEGWIEQERQHSSSGFVK
jgi:hypothetical protein